MLASKLPGGPETGAYAGAIRVAEVPAEVEWSANITNPKNAPRLRCEMRLRDTANLFAGAGIARR